MDLVSPTRWEFQTKDESFRGLRACLEDRFEACSEAKGVHNQASHGVPSRAEKGGMR